MATRPKASRASKQQQSLSLDKDTVEALEKEAERRGVAKSQLADLFLSSQLEVEQNKPTILSVISFKGGVAKTTTSVCLAVCLAEKGYKVLVIDMDSQGNASAYLSAYDPRSEDPCIADVLYRASSSKSPVTLEEVMCETDYENLYIVPSNFRFSDADARMKSESSAGADTRLKYAIEDLNEDFDYIIVDCGPRLDMTTTNAIVALEAGNRASSIIIPIKVDGFAIAGVSQTIDVINRTARDRRTQPRPWRILRTMVEQNTQAYKIGLEQLKEVIPNANYFVAKIDKSTAVPESSLAMEPLVTYAPTSKPALAYRMLADEIEDYNE